MATNDGTKTCRKCGVVKPLADFPRMQGGFRPRCKPCHTEDSMRWQTQNHHKYLANLRSWYDKNRRNPRVLLSPEEKIRRKNASNKKWREENHERFVLIRKQYAEKNPHVQREVTRRRQAAKRRATPKWGNRFFIQEAYHLAEVRTKVCGGKWVVDHIVPIISPIVCGLHVEANLQVLPMVTNIRKGNRYWPDMP